MKKTLKLISVCAGIIGVLSVFVLGFTYYETAVGYIKEKFIHKEVK